MARIILIIGVDLNRALPRLGYSYYIPSTVIVLGAKNKSLNEIIHITMKYDRYNRLESLVVIRGQPHSHAPCLVVSAHSAI